MPVISRQLQKLYGADGKSRLRLSLVLSPSSPRLHELDVAYTSLSFRRMEQDENSPRIRLYANRTSLVGKYSTYVEILLKSQFFECFSTAPPERGT